MTAETCVVVERHANSGLKFEAKHVRFWHGLLEFILTTRTRKKPLKLRYSRTTARAEKTLTHIVVEVPCVLIVYGTSNKQIGN